MGSRTHTKEQREKKPRKGERERKLNVGEERVEIEVKKVNKCSDVSKKLENSRSE